MYLLFLGIKITPVARCYYAWYNIACSEVYCLQAEACNGIHSHSVLAYRVAFLIKNL
nr:MAG TPA: hypothetical protein [Caudoviricetes sp.]DAS06667.1 MAG TPA: hypothetical protein [Caudoviricetes sp.]DAS46210.1 MAG TPA: hypothetical protein [Caudoviricetes sp.]